MNKEEFLMWEQKTRDTIDFKKIYVDMADDLVAGLMLSQIVYWSLPANNGKSKLRIKREGEYWIAKGHKDWYEEVRITVNQAPRAIKILVEKGLIVKRRFKFNGTPMIHIRIDWDNFLKSFNEQLKNDKKESKLGNHSNGNGEIPIIESGDYDDSLTEKTTKTKTKNNKNLRADSAKIFLNGIEDGPTTENNDRLVELYVPDMYRTYYKDLRTRISISERNRAVELLNNYDQVFKRKDSNDVNPNDITERWEATRETAKGLSEIFGVTGVEHDIIANARIMLQDPKEVERVENQQKLEKQRKINEKKQKLEDMKDWLYGSLYDLGEAFVLSTHIFPNEKDKSQWVKAFSEMNEIGITPYNVRMGVRRMNELGLLIKNPFSIMTAAKQYYAIDRKNGF